MNTLFPLTITDRSADCVDFYRDLLGYEVMVDIGWYVQLHDPADTRRQLAFMSPDHESIPAGFSTTPAGVIMTFEIDDADALHERAVSLGLTIHHPPRDEEWGQRHFITEDPAGLLVDVVQPIEPTREFLERHGLLDAATNPAG